MDNVEQMIQDVKEAKEKMDSLLRYSFEWLDQREVYVALDRKLEAETGKCYYDYWKERQ